METTGFPISSITQLPNRNFGLDVLALNKPKLCKCFFYAHSYLMVSMKWQIKDITCTTSVAERSSSSASSPNESNLKFLYSMKISTLSLCLWRKFFHTTLKNTQILSHRRISVHWITTKLERNEWNKVRQKRIWKFTLKIYMRMPHTKQYIFLSDMT